MDGQKGIGSSMEWLRGLRHVFLLDPDKQITDEALMAVCASDTDAIFIGGSTGLTFINVADLLRRVRRCNPDKRCVLELSDMGCGVPGFDYYLVPHVLNSSRVSWVIAQQAKALERFGAYLPWDKVCAVGYIVLNAQATVAAMSEACADISLPEVLGYALVADRLWRMPLLYLEYSGKFGDMQVVRAVREQMREAHLFYGGGVDSAERAREAAVWADTVVVGNVIYTDLAAALTTVDAVHEVT
jgi:putative glycerol-1-phosphate prenyltransferase